MNIIKKILCIAVVTASYFAPCIVSAQETTVAASSLAPIAFNNHISWGVHYAGGDASYGRGVLMLSTSYGRHILPWLELELAAQGFVFSEGGVSPFPWSPSINVQGSSGPVSSWNSNTIFLDLAAMMQPFQGVGLRFGIGPTLRIWQTARLGVGWSSIQRQGATEPESYINIQNERFRAWQLGANAKLEYLIPLSQQCDISLRLQGHIVTQPFSVTDVQTSYPYPPQVMMGQFGGGASLGTSLRLGF